MLRKAGILLAVAAIGAIPSAALADHQDRGRDEFRRGNRGGESRRDDDRRDHDRGHSDHRSGGYFDILIGGGTFSSPRPPFYPPPPCEERVWVPPVYRTVCDRRWVEPVYRTVCDRVWIEPVTQTTCERIWVADRYESRNVDQWANGRRYTRATICSGRAGTLD